MFGLNESLQRDRNRTRQRSSHRACRTRRAHRHSIFRSIACIRWTALYRMVTRSKMWYMNTSVASRSSPGPYSAPLTTTSIQSNTRTTLYCDVRISRYKAKSRLQSSSRRTHLTKRLRTLELSRFQITCRTFRTHLP